MLKPALRERLLGALVFLCLGLIFYPAIFDTRNEFVVDRDSQIPEQLVRVEPMTLEQPVVPDSEAVVPTADQMFVANEEPVSADELESRPNILDEDGVPNAWVLQAGSFADQANAADLEQRLLAADFRAYVRQTQTTEDVRRYRVFVGPYLDRAIAQADSAELSSSGFATPLILEFSP